MAELETEPAEAEQPDAEQPDAEQVVDDPAVDEAVPAGASSDEAVSGDVAPEDVAPATSEESTADDAAEAEADGDHEAADAVLDDVTSPDDAAAPSPDAAERPVVLSIKGIVKRYGTTVAVEGVDLDVRAGSFYGIVGPNGAGKTTTLSIVTGLLRPDAGSVSVLGSDVWDDPAAAKRALGVLPDRLRLFDRLTGAQLLYYSATLRGLDGVTARKRSADLAAAFGLQDALGRLVADYSVGMTKKIALAAAVIHSPRVLVLDEPFESVDPVSAATVTEVLQRYVAGGGTVLLSSHSMDLVERICDSVAVIVDGHVLASGTVDEVRAGRSLEQTFVELAGGRAVTEGMEWLQSFSD
ncbi:ABC transporter ATP-binding protein [Frigoribacterium sp. ACAM 257]|nr:ABC transporter ATP-binding protein [Frigoribacterium sp. ACAM 257]